MKKYLKIFLIVFFLSSLFFNIINVNAVSTDEEALVNIVGENFIEKIKKPQTKINIPGVEFSDLTAEENLEIDSGGNVYLKIPFLGEFVSGIYKYLIIFASIVAIIMIIISGIQWIISAGNTDTISTAKKRITGAIIGLILILTSYNILYIINPNLVEFKNLRVLYITTQILDIEGFPETESPESQNINVVSSIDKSQCDYTKLPIFSKENIKFGKENGYCLGWVNQAINNMCGGLPSVFNKSGAWDVATSFKKQNKFTACTLDGIKDGDIVFMTSIGSNYIGLWENFKYDETAGCTLADTKDTATKLKGGKEVPYPAGVNPSQEGIPPVTHIGIYYDKKIYHLLNGVVSDDISEIKNIKKRVLTEKQLKKHPNWKDVEISGNFIHNGKEFIAGYASLK